MKKTTLTGLAVLSAFLLWLGWPPIPHTALLLLVAFVPLLFAVDTIRNSEVQKKGRLIFRLTFLCFFIWNTASIYWVYNSLVSVMSPWVAVLVALIPFSLAPLLMSLAFVLYHRVARFTGKSWAYLALLCFWIAYEYLHQSWDLAFPWMTLGNGFSGSTYLVQWYEYTGVYGGTVWIWLCNILGYELISAMRAKAPVRRVATELLIVILLPLGFSLTRYFSYTETSNPSNMVVVQPNIDPYAKFGSMPAAVQLQQLIHLSDSLGQNNTEYFIWPETAISGNTNEAGIRNELSYQTIRSFLSKYKNANLISGIESYAVYDSEKTPTAQYYPERGIYYDSFNAAVQLENSEKVQFYHKSKLVPGVEQTPFSNALGFMKPLFAKFGGTTGGYAGQEEPSVFYSASGIGAAPVICYESIWGSYVAEYVNKGAQFIAIVTNDGWWGNTSGKDQHLDYARLRAIETRRWVVRSANTGISAFIDQRGDIVQKTHWWVPAAIKQDINLNEKITFYTRYGDYIARSACLGALLFIIFAAFRRFRTAPKN
jgi:apolipoprotein N-acyltransferase